MKKVFVVGLVILMGLILVGVISFNNGQDKEIISAYDEIFAIQQDMDKEIKGYIADKQYTFENPKVLLNPYKLSPLTALVIFQTDDEQSVDVKVNDKFSASVEKGIQHAIPIYGMYADFENVIELTLSNGTSKKLTIKTDKYEGDEVKLVKTSEEVKDDLFLLSPNFVNNCIIDGKGNVVWYLNGGYAGDIEYLDNGHFYISDPKQGLNGVKINYSSFLEMDYLGKIYKQWVVEYGLHHELVPLADNKMIVLGANDDSDFFDSYICMVDLTTGKTLKYIDLYELLHNIDAELIEGLGTDFDLVNNSVDYDEKTGDMLISLRGLNSLMKLNFNTSEIKWIFGDPEFWGDKFSKYVLKVKDDTRFLGGQHSAFYTEEGLIAVHNNDIDQFDLETANLSHYLDRYSSCDFYKVDEKKMTIETVWQYTADKKLFSNVAGHMELLDDSNKLVTYGWAMTEEAFEKPEEVLYTDPVYKNGVVREINKKNEVVFEARIPGLIYRTYKIENLYVSDLEEFAGAAVDGVKISNFEVKAFERINGTKINGQSIEVSSIADKLDVAQKYANKVEIYNNRVSLNGEFKIEDSVDVVFVSEDNLVYVYYYKEAGKEGPKSFNSGFVSKKMNVKDGIYKVFVKINDEFFDAGMKVEF